jgi:hypothetical protein
MTTQDWRLGQPGHTSSPAGLRQGGLSLMSNQTDLPPHPDVSSGVEGGHVSIRAVAAKLAGRGSYDDDDEL